MAGPATTEDETTDDEIDELASEFSISREAAEKRLREHDGDYKQAYNALDEEHMEALREQARTGDASESYRARVVVKETESNEAETAKCKARYSRPSGAPTINTNVAPARMAVPAPNGSSTCSKCGGRTVLRTSQTQRNPGRVYIHCENCAFLDWLDTANHPMNRNWA